MSSQRRLIDTNVIVRHLLQDDPKHGPAASNLFAASDRGELTLVILPAVLAECVFVLESFYQRARSDVSRSLRELLNSSGVEIDYAPVYINALNHYGNSRLHFVDCMLAAFAVRSGMAIASFDQGLGKVQGIQIDTAS